MRRLTISFVVLVLALVAAPALAGEGGEAGASLLDDPRLVEVKADLEALLDSLGEEGLPVEPFEAKIREGLVKKVAPSKILAALEAMHVRFVKVTALFVKSGAKKGKASVQLGAGLLAAGTSETDVARLLAGLASCELDKTSVDKALLVALMMTEKGNGDTAVDEVLAILGKKGTKGLDAWLAKQKSTATDEWPSPAPTPPGKTKGKGKSPKPHGK